MLNENQNTHKPDKEKDPAESRRNFLKLGLGLGVASLATIAVGKMIPAAGEAKPSKGEKVKVLTTDGKVVEIDKDQIEVAKEVLPADRVKARQGIPGRKFVMLIDLAKCKNARACITACQEGHHLPPHHEWMKVYLMQDSEETAPYWFPRPCFHCDNPMCVSVCPVGATYKRTDGIVLVDSARCIGCKFCITGCPYSVRVLNWKKYEEFEEVKDVEYSHETHVPGVEGTVGKCVFCIDKIRNNELPRCVTACPMGVIYFGDLVEDTVTNGSETLRFTEIIYDKSGYRFLEELGTMPSVYYLPPTTRQFPFERGLDDLDSNVMKRYENTLYFKKKKKTKKA
jgi:molybdopterin-containing oxidoreductase family iron-sulfur binding subunit